MNNTDNKKKLGLSALVSIAAGSSISGVVSTLGLATGQTGRAAWLAYAVAVVIGGVIRVLPTVFFTSMFRFKGGNYTLVTASLGNLPGGIYALWWVPMFFSRGVIAIALGEYVHSIFPAVPAMWAGVILSTLFFIVNLFGVNSMAKLQKPLAVVAIIALGVFTFVGYTKLQPGSINIMAPGYFINGGMGFIIAITLVIQSTSAPSLVCGFSWEAQNPKRNIPLAIFISAGIVFIIYVGLSLVASNVLPIAEIAGKPLTYAAQHVLPAILLPIFLITGPILTLCTSMNSGMASISAPVISAVRNGWLPVSIGQTNKHGSPWIIYTVMWLICVVPMMLGVSLKSFTAYTVMTQRICGMIILAAAFRFPAKFRKQWEKSFLHVPDPIFYALLVFITMIEVSTLAMSIITISLPVFLGNVILVSGLAIYACYRYKAGKTYVNIAMEDDDSVIQPTHSFMEDLK